MNKITALTGPGRFGELLRRAATSLQGGQSVVFLSFERSEGEIRAGLAALGAPLGRVVIRQAETPRVVEEVESAVVGRTVDLIAAEVPIQTALEVEILRAWFAASSIRAEFVFTSPQSRASTGATERADHMVRCEAHAA